MFLLILGGCVRPLKYQPAMGVVIDPITREPITGARVSLDCRVLRFVHGTRSIAERIVNTDSNGEYQHKAAFVFPTCNFIASADKMGYMPVSEISAQYAEIARRNNGDNRYKNTNKIYLVKLEDYSLHRLNEIIDEFSGYDIFSGYGVIGNPDPDDPYIPYNYTPEQYEHYFTSSFLGLMKAREHASTPDQIQLVATTFCNVVTNYYNKLTAEQISKLINTKYTLVIRKAITLDAKRGNDNQSYPDSTYLDDLTTWERKDYYINIDTAKKWCQTALTRR